MQLKLKGNPLNLNDLREMSDKYLIFFSCHIGSNLKARPNPKFKVQKMNRDVLIPQKPG